MGQILRGSARTTEAIRRAIQNSQASLRNLASAMASTRRQSLNGADVHQEAEGGGLDGPR
jgi:hypothetical protein